MVNLGIFIFILCIVLKIYFKNIIINLGICIAPTQLFRAALGAERTLCYPNNTADSQPYWTLTNCNLLQWKSPSTANQNGRSTHRQCWGSIHRPWTRQHTALTIQPSPTWVKTYILTLCFNDTPLYHPSSPHPRHPLTTTITTISLPPAPH
jgi:hypothetical protein